MRPACGGDRQSRITTQQIDSDCVCVRVCMCVCVLYVYAARAVAIKTKRYGGTLHRPNRYLYTQVYALALAQRYPVACSRVRDALCSAAAAVSVYIPLRKHTRTRTAPPASDHHFIITHAHAHTQTKTFTNMLASGAGLLSIDRSYT